MISINIIVYNLVNNETLYSTVLIMELNLNYQQQRRIIQHFHSLSAKIRGHVSCQLIKRNCIVSERTCPHIFTTISE